ncbi:MAG TPA: alpha/beta family hydrolase [Candidatus Binataceae bacterium]|nr:alpha/beta family hydrolase [Candidatus Binataceae bacterium]
MNESAVTFRSGELTLEGRFARPARAGASPGAVICHPHPMYGGSMDNNVVEAIVSAMWRCGYATLRFNFRGVGASEGEYDGGAGEADDARAALSFLSEQGCAGGLVLAGYSFGAGIAMRAGLGDSRVARVIAVALPVAAMDSGADAPATQPVLFVSGDRDSYSPIATLEQTARTLGAAATLRVIAGTDHFFGGSESALADAIERGLQGA